MKTREPAALPPMQADSAENSESTSICFALNLPDAIIFPRFSTMWVWGVMGYATTMSGSHSAAAFAAARLPSITVFVMVSLFFYLFFYCFYGAFVHADEASFAVVVVDYAFFVYDLYTTVRAEALTYSAAGAFVLVYYGLEGAPCACLVYCCASYVCYYSAGDVFFCHDHHLSEVVVYFSCCQYVCVRYLFWHVLFDGCLN